MNRSSQQAGLTLVELMVVVAVLAILATIAYPLYTQQAQKSRRTDARTALQTIAQAEERFFTVTGSYTAFLTSLQIDTVMDTACAGVDVSTCNTANGAYSVTLTQPGGGNTFLATATPLGPQTGDDCTSLNVNQIGVRGFAGTNCW